MYICMMLYEVYIKYSGVYYVKYREIYSINSESYFACHVVSSCASKCALGRSADSVCDVNSCSCASKYALGRSTDSVCDVNSCSVW